MGKTFLDALKYIDSDAECFENDLTPVDHLEQVETSQPMQAQSVTELEQAEQLSETATWQILAS